jgi:Ca2+-binding RTX toxin-like protein
VLVDLNFNTQAALVVGVVDDAAGDFLNGFENILGSKEADTLIGNGLANVITGGKGADTLTGGASGATFRFAKLSHKGDHITDFLSGTDKLEFDDAGFANTDVGVTNFAFGTVPTPADKSGWFLYDTDNGELRFDADGTGKGKAVLLLTLDGAPTLLDTDILIV